MALQMKLKTELDELLKATEASLVNANNSDHFIGVCRCKNHSGKKRSLSIRLTKEGNVSVSCHHRCEEQEIYKDLRKFGDRITKFEKVEPFVKCPRDILKSVGKTLGEINPFVPRALAKVKFSANDFLIYVAQRSYSDESVKGPSFPLIATLMELTGLSKSAVSRARRNLVALKFMIPQYRVRPTAKIRAYDDEIICFATQEEADRYIGLNTGSEQASTSFTFPEINLSPELTMPDSPPSTPFDDPASLPSLSELKMKPKRLRLKLRKVH